MGLQEATIEVDRSSGTPTFRFHSAAGPVRAMMLAVGKEGAAEPTWWVATEDFNTWLPYTATAQIYPEGKEPPEMKPLKDQADDRISAATSNRELGVVRYGEVPPGFRQAVPRGGGAPELEAGVRYSVMIIGACYGGATFEA